MRIEFDSKTTLEEQRKRVASSKQPGRKHQKRMGSKAKERQKASKKRGAKLKVIQKKKYGAKVAAYWRGETEEYPAS